MAYLLTKDAYYREVAEPLAAAYPPAEAIDLIFEAIAEHARERGFRGSPFLNAAAEYPDADHPVRCLVTSHRDWIRTLFQDLLTRIGHTDTDPIGRLTPSKAPKEGHQGVAHRFGMGRLGHDARCQGRRGAGRRGPPSPWNGLVSWSFFIPARRATGTVAVLPPGEGPSRTAPEAVRQKDRSFYHPDGSSPGALAPLVNPIERSLTVHR
ncbi:hypothetical protein [Streptomyces sp. NPDC001530]|uniref:hypothetical protein n=1 Tax=Streptomyces sp. NPDC001530 TaxID=3364582 RepID=UPI0036BEBE7F